MSGALLALADARKCAGTARPEDLAEDGWLKLAKRPA